MNNRCRWLPVLLLAPLAVAAPAQEIQRPPATAQAVDVLHTVRQVPEACIRIEGRFTGQANAPYDMRLVRTGAQCQPRAVWLDFAQVTPDEGGWKLNDRIRIPAAECRGQQALVEVWRRPVEQPLARDGQGQVRVYLDDARRQAGAGRLAALPAYAARLEMEGRPCR
ncbi:conserved exported hypothetical protein [uncultured Stenotrophomonas sp.]|uniref:Secreted protein n=1 Tax=uncultured Stenotrophomonas sp. TaxID=165438 RepID=A0A1Y5Q3E7_9GAMM|nr:conserved exported hypothetical protein [uncultured Stenotrophomonas sp.]